MLEVPIWYRAPLSGVITTEDAEAFAEWARQLIDANLASSPLPDSAQPASGTSTAGVLEGGRGSE